MQTNTKPKICFVADAADIHTQRWAKYFADNGYQVHIISRNPSAEIAENIYLHVLRSHCVKRSILRYVITPLSLLLQIRRLLKIIKPDIVHCFSVLFHTIITTLTGFHPLLIFPWGGDVLTYPRESIIMRYGVPFALRRADIIICDGENAREAMMRMGIENERIKTVMQGVDTKKFNPSCRDEKLREKLKLYDSPTVISTRRFSRYHNIGTIVQAIPLVLKQIPEAKFVFIGEGEQKEEVMALARSLNIFNATRFLGSVPNDELPKYLVSSDIHVSMTVLDSGFSIATAEAMLCELPVIVTDFGDNRRWVEDGKNGFIVPPKDPKRLADKIIYLLRNEDVRMEFGKRNREIIEERNNYYREMEKMDNIYKELIRKYKS